VKGKWANVETQLQRRSDLINNLVESAKLAGVQEQEVFGKIAEARSKLLNAQQQAPQGEAGDKSPEQKQAVIDAANSFGGTIGRLLVLQENYPQLQSNQNFLKLQDEVAGTENRIATSRKDYNEATQDYNTTRAKFPTVISAKLFGFKEEPYFKAEEGATQPPRINADTLRPNQNTAPTK
jgi:LemA protein